MRRTRVCAGHPTAAVGRFAGTDGLRDDALDDDGAHVLQSLGDPLDALRKRAERGMTVPKGTRLTVPFSRRCC